MKLLSVLTFLSYSAISSSFILTTTHNGDLPTLTTLHLFNGPRSDTTIERTSRPKASSFKLPSKVPAGVFEDLRSKDISLPFEFQLNKKESSTLVVRQLEKEDVSTAVSMCLKEYGSYPSTASTKSDVLSKKFDAELTEFENFMFSFIVLIGLGQRVERREKSDVSQGLPQDHNVILLSTIGPNGEDTPIGMAEISLQPPDPARTSPPFVVPTNLKRIFSFIYGAPDPCPYVSNVLIRDEYRGEGYGKVLMAACEGLAKSWDYDSVYLHVDADPSSGGPAQRLYSSLGYAPVVNNKYNEKFSWMGIDQMNKGLYIVDGVALLFLKKLLR